MASSRTLTASRNAFSRNNTKQKSFTFSRLKLKENTQSVHPDCVFSFCVRCCNVSHCCQKLPDHRELCSGERRLRRSWLLVFGVLLRREGLSRSWPLFLGCFLRRAVPSPELALNFPTSLTTAATKKAVECAIITFHS